LPGLNRNQNNRKVVTCIQQDRDRKLRVHGFWTRDRLELRPEFFSLASIWHFFVYDQINDQYFSYLLVTLRKEVSIKLFLIVFHHVVLFRFKDKNPAETGWFKYRIEPMKNGPVVGFIHLEKGEVFLNFSSSNSQQLLLSNIYTLFCLIISSKNMMSFQELMNLIFSYLNSLFNTTESLHNL
jgi:hypothetical protein